MLGNWSKTIRLLLFTVFFVVGLGVVVQQRVINSSAPIPENRTEVVFWHFWGGSDRDVVEDVVRRFNESQSEHWVRAIAIPGNNLDAKLFLSIAGEDPPDIVNQDDPILADWYERGAIQSVTEFAGTDTAREMTSFLLPSARRLVTYDGELLAIPNGLDIRALYYNKTFLQINNLEVPQTIAEFDQIIRAISPPKTKSANTRDRTPGYFAYLPDSRRLWAWGFVFGGQFFDESNRLVTIDSPPIASALNWMTQFGHWYSVDSVTAFRHGDQSLPGKSFPLLPQDEESIVGRYVFLMDGQWRTRDIAAFTGYRKKKNLPAVEFGVCPLPYPDNGRPNSGWVNGNFFVVPRGSKNARGALEFAKFWIGMTDPEQAAITCASGGWVPVSDSVVHSDHFQAYLKQQPLFAKFVELSGSENMFPYPLVRAAPFFKRTVEAVADRAITDIKQSPKELLSDAATRIQNRLDADKKHRESP